ncbi:beta-ketoacyl reductase [Actinomadura keratinilytica]
MTPSEAPGEGVTADAETALGRRLASGARVLTLCLSPETLADRTETTRGSANSATPPPATAPGPRSPAWSPPRPRRADGPRPGPHPSPGPGRRRRGRAPVVPHHRSRRHRPPGRRGLAPARAQLWGLGRVAALEHADRWGGLVDLPGTGTAPDAALWDDVVTALHGTEDQLAVRPGAVLARRLVPAPRTTGAGPGWTPRGTVLITGGTGALARHVARRLAATGASHLVLAGRRGPDAPDADALREELTALGAQVTLAACDLSDRDSVAALLAEHPVDAVVHTAGVARLTPLDRLTAAELAETNAAKVTGADLLDDLLGDRPLDAFVLFSSIAGVWGSGDHGAYAAANAHLDALAHRRRAAGRPATSVAWGPWAGSGMAADGGVLDDLRRRGLTALQPEAAVDALFDALAATTPPRSSPRSTGPASPASSPSPATAPSSRRWPPPPGRPVTATPARTPRNPRRAPTRRTNCAGNSPPCPRPTAAPHWSTWSAPPRPRSWATARGPASSPGAASSNWASTR